MLRASMTIAAALPSWVRSGSQIHMPLPSGSGEPGVPVGPPARSVTGGAGLAAGVGAGLGAGAAGAAGARRVAALARAGAGDAATCRRRGHGPGAGTPAVLAGSAAAAATAAPPVRPWVRAVLMPPTRRPPTANPARKRRAAPEHTGGLVEDLEPLARGLVARVEDEAVSVDDRGRADIRLVAPVDRARRGAGRAQDALRGVVEAGAVFGALEALGVAGVVGVHEVRHHGPVLLEERFHVDDEIFDDRKATNGLDGDVAPGLSNEQHTGQRVLAVDHHRIGPAHAVRARAPEAERAVLVPLGRVQRVEDAVALLHLDVELLPVGLAVALGVEPLHLEMDLHQLGVGHQYFRSIGR